MFTILSDSSQNVSLDEMKLAYQDFVENTISICTSNKYMDIFRALNLIHIEITVMKRGKKMFSNRYIWISYRYSLIMK